MVSLSPFDKLRVTYVMVPSVMVSLSPFDKLRVTYVMVPSVMARWFDKLTMTLKGDPA
jgi:hypothetical protein